MNESEFTSRLWTNSIRFTLSTNLHWASYQVDTPSGVLQCGALFSLIRSWSVLTWVMDHEDQFGALQCLWKENSEADLYCGQDSKDNRPAWQLKQVSDLIMSTSRSIQILIQFIRLYKLTSRSVCSVYTSLLTSALRPPSLIHFMFFLRFFAFPCRKQRKFIHPLFHTQLFNVRFYLTTKVNTSVHVGGNCCGLKNLWFKNLSFWAQSVEGEAY